MSITITSETLPRDFVELFPSDLHVGESAWFDHKTWLYIASNLRCYVPTDTRVYLLKTCTDSPMAIITRIQDTNSSLEFNLNLPPNLGKKWKRCRYLDVEGFHKINLITIEGTHIHE